MKVSFGARNPLSYRKAEKALLELSRKGVLSETYFASKSCCAKSTDSALICSRLVKRLLEKVNIIRHDLTFREYSSANEYYECIKKKVLENQVGNCFELSGILHHQLQKAGINSKHVELSADHCVVLVDDKNRAKEFTFRDISRGAFIVDPWLKNIFKSSEAAFLHLKHMLEVSKDSKLKDISGRYPEINVQEFPLGYIFGRSTGYSTFTR